jgi:halocyanin-like protein
MRRRQFLATAGGVATATAAGSAAAGSAAAQETPAFPGYLDDASNEEFEDLRGEGSVTVEVGAGSSQFQFAPGLVWIDPGTTVTFEWVGDLAHNVVPRSQPDGAGWEGYDTLEGGGFTYEHTFETEGIYAYFCSPHEGNGMKGGIAVGEVETESEGGGGGEGGGGELHPEEMGVPFRAHFVGIATLLGIAVALVFTFYLLKYGESAHSSSPNRK